jgi:hypothetical protein
VTRALASPCSQRHGPLGHDYVDIGEAAYEEQYMRRLASLKESERSLGFALQEVASG